MPGTVSDLEQRAYFTHELHELLADDAWKSAGPNIGRNGENLTIAFLSLERASLSVRLLKSIAEHMPSFAGEVLAIDNGSSAECLEALSSAMEALPCRQRLVPMGQNHGVAGGRNRGTSHAVTDWVMWLDNDIFFIGNPLERIQSDIARLGCHFISLPLLQPDRRTLFAKGGHLYLGFLGSELRLGAGSVASQEAARELDGPGFLSTFLFGGACVVSKSSFQRSGGYDDNVLVGFEDIDFSLRLFREGMKVGSTGAVALVHDHHAPYTTADRDYEARRHGDEAIRASAAYFERKHGFRLWSNSTAAWLDDRRVQLGLPAVRTGSPEGGKAPAKPKVGLVVDVDNWSFSNIASQIIRLLDDRYEFALASITSVSKDVFKILQMFDDCDQIHFFWRDDLMQLHTHRAARQALRLGYDLKTFRNRYLTSKTITTSVFDHLYLQPEMIERKRPIFSEFTNAYAVSSRRLEAIYRGIPGYPPPAAVIPDGVDLRLFQPQNLGRLEKRAGDGLVVGWAGNSVWRQEQGDHKGLKTILQPALQELASEGRPICGSFADRAVRHMPFENMPDYYASIDVLVCASDMEGTPNPVLEAMACGVPVISTDVGIVPEAFGPHQRNFLLSERSVPAMKAAVSRLLDDPAQLSALSRENLVSVKAWDWPIRVGAYADFLDRARLSFESRRSAASVAR